MTIIDAHAHLWERARTPQPWIDPVSMSVIDRDFGVAELGAMQTSNGISGSVIVQSSNSEQETLDLLALAASPTVLGVVGWVDLEGDVSAAIERLRSAPGGDALVGIRHLAHRDADPRWLSRPAVRMGLAALASAGLPFDVVVLPGQLGDVADTAAAHPETVFVLNHLGKPPIASGDLTEWMHDLTRIAALPNTVAKLSGLVVEASWLDWVPGDLRPVMDHALQAFGPDRLMFGTDWPVVELAGGVGRWLDVLGSLSEPERTAIFAETATRTYELHA